MSINFPSNPSIDQVYTAGTRTWKFDGVVWRIQNLTTGYTGSASTAAGYAGSLGFTGSMGAGYTGSASTAAGYAGSLGFTGSMGANGVGFAGSSGFVGSAGAGSSSDFLPPTPSAWDDEFTGPDADNITLDAKWINSNLSAGAIPVNLVRWRNNLVVHGTRPTGQGAIETGPSRPPSFRFAEQVAPVKANGEYTFVAKVTTGVDYNGTYPGICIGNASTGKHLLFYAEAPSSLVASSTIKAVIFASDNETASAPSNGVALAAPGRVFWLRIDLQWNYPNGYNGGGGGVDYVYLSLSTDGVVYTSAIQYETPSVDIGGVVDRIGIGWYTYLNQTRVAFDCFRVKQATTFLANSSAGFEAP